jgi:hypothetical protein
VTFIDKSVMTEKEPDVPIFTDFIFYKKMFRSVARFYDCWIGCSGVHRFDLIRGVTFGGRGLKSALASLEKDNLLSILLNQCI